ncbi:hypothetical protein [Leptospira koniambonensis]|uniref:hypothetical protein n=1 Tax=Leptospira koniambonensis TaxID=2484950 RepID=UPI003EBEC64B
MKQIIHIIYFITWMPFYLIIELSESFYILTHFDDPEIVLGIGAGAAGAGFFLFGILFLGLLISLVLSLIYILYKRSKESVYTIFPLILAVPFFVDQIFPLFDLSLESVRTKEYRILWQTMLASLLPLYYFLWLIEIIRKKALVRSSNDL